MLSARLLDALPSSSSSGQPVHAAVRRTFTVLAPLYDALVPFISRTAHRRGLERLAVQDGETVLDVGIGTGRSLPALLDAAPAGRVWGIDATPAMVRRARRRVPPRLGDSVVLTDGDAASLPLPDAAVDAVFSSYTLDTMPADERVRSLREIGRVLRPAGRLVTVTMGRPRTPVGHLWASLAGRAPALLGHARPVAMAPLLQREGFQVTDRERTTQMGFPSDIVCARKTDRADPVSGSSFPSSFTFDG
jgi:demethylmenaquinone methyltransferase/2-methoxy-6-polyprenyl-1,4-benzoquinol methylase